MRLTDLERQVIQQKVLQILGASARVFLFGSRLDDHANGGDIDLLIEVTEPVNNPAELAAKINNKLLPAWLNALGEQTGVAIDNLDKAEKLSVLASADQWLKIRQLRNQMIP